jgi:hypothetical protein
MVAKLGEFTLMLEYNGLKVIKWLSINLNQTDRVSQPTVQ